MTALETALEKSNDIFVVPETETGNEISEVEYLMARADFEAGRIPDLNIHLQRLRTQRLDPSRQVSKFPETQAAIAYAEAQLAEAREAEAAALGLQNQFHQLNARVKSARLELGVAEGRTEELNARRARILEQIETKFCDPKTDFEPLEKGTELLLATEKMISLAPAIVAGKREALATLEAELSAFKREHGIA